MKDNKNELIYYKAKLDNERKRFRNYLGCCERYITNKRIKEIKYHG